MKKCEPISRRSPRSTHRWVDACQEGDACQLCPAVFAEGDPQYRCTSRRIVGSRPTSRVWLAIFVFLTLVIVGMLVGAFVDAFHHAGLRGVYLVVVALVLGFGAVVLWVASIARTLIGFADEQNRREP